MSKTDKRLARIALVRRLCALAVLLALATVLDPLVFRLFAASAEVNGQTVWRKNLSFESNDWYRLLRVVGSFWTWLAVAALLFSADRRGTNPYRRAVYVLAAVAIAGIGAELLKLIVGRERPVDGLDYQGFIFAGPFAGFAGAGNLGFPSSHAAAAFGGAAALSRLLPALTVPLLALAAGCALSRVMVGAHWTSDAAAGAAIGLAAAYWLYPRVGFPPTPSSGPTNHVRFG